MPNESHEDEVDVGIRETGFFGAYLQNMKKGGDGDCTFARLDIVKGVLADVMLSRQHIVGLGTVLRQRLNLSTEPLEGGVGVKSGKCLLVHEKFIYLVPDAALGSYQF